MQPKSSCTVHYPTILILAPAIGSSFAGAGEFKPSETSAERYLVRPLNLVGLALERDSANS